VIRRVARQLGVGDESLRAWVHIPAMSHEPRPPAAESQLGKGGQAYDGESRRPIRAGHRVSRTSRNDHGRRRPRDIRGMCDEISDSPTEASSESDAEVRRSAAR
jgi:transposase-like protein